jgi:hypothetical protein
MQLFKDGNSQLIDAGGGRVGEGAMRKHDTLSYSTATPVCYSLPPGAPPVNRSVIRGAIRWGLGRSVLPKIAVPRD